MLKKTLLKSEKCLFGRDQPWQAFVTAKLVIFDIVLCQRCCRVLQQKVSKIKFWSLCSIKCYILDLDMSKSFENPFLLCPWSVKLAIWKYSAAGPNIDFFPMVPPPWNFYSPFGTPKEARTISPAAKCFLMANSTFHGHSRNGFWKDVENALFSIYILHSVLFCLLKNVLDRYKKIILKKSSYMLTLLWVLSHQGSRHLQKSPTAPVIRLGVIHFLDITPVLQGLNSQAIYII